jgi:hypothetical protein
MADIETRVREIMALKNELQNQFGVKRNPDCEDPLVYGGVVESDVIARITPVVEKYFGPAYKPAGQTAYLGNWFDSFIKAVGGVRPEQTLYRVKLEPGIDLYCAFWPWGSNPIKTSVRLGLLCDDTDREEKLGKALRDCF